MFDIPKHLPFIALLLTVSCSGDCSCSGFTPKDFPAEKYSKTIPTSGSIRMTAEGLKFIEDNLPKIVEAAVPGGLNFCIPKSTSGRDMCYRGETCADGSLGCQMTITIDDASVTPKPNDTLEIAITLGGLDETITMNPGLGRDCKIKLHSKANDNLPGTVDATLPIVFSVDAQSPLKNVVIKSGETNADIGDLDFKISGDFGCGALNLGFIKNMIKDELKKQIAPILDGILEPQVCKTCDMAACPSSSTCNADSICELPSGECDPQVFGTEGELKIGESLGDNSEVPDAKVDLIVRLADVAKVDTGLTLGLRNGYDPTAIHNCIPVDPGARDFAAPPLSAAIIGDKKPNGQPYMIGLGYHKKAIEHLLWAVWGSGATCMSINNDALSTGTLSAFLPSLKTLAMGTASQAFIKIVPQDPPVIVLGANKVTPDGDGYKVDDALMNIDWKNFDIHIFAYVQSRFTRVATIRIDLLLPIALVPTADGKIIPILGDIDAAVKNPRVISSELLAEDPQRLIDIIPTFVGMALPGIAGSISDPIELPDFQGFKIIVGEGDITSVDNNQSIALFADLEIAAAMPILSRLDTRIGNLKVDYSQRSKSGLIRPSINLSPVAYIPSDNFTEGLLGAEQVEYSYRIDGSTWHLPLRGETLHITHPLLMLPGKHVVELKARRIGDAQSEDISPISYDFYVDYQSPEGELGLNENVLSIDVKDDVSTSNQLRMRSKIVGIGNSSWSDWTELKPISLKDIPENSLIRAEVEVRDEVGNTLSLERSLRVQNMDKKEKTPKRIPLSKSDGCSTADPSPSSLLFFFFFVGFLLVRKRSKTKTKSRRSPIALSMLMVALSLSSCDCSDGTSEDKCDCSDEETCVNEACVPKTCTENSDCGDNICKDGACVDPSTCPGSCSCGDDEKATCTEDGECKCEQFCKDGCGDKEYCCYTSDSCEPKTDPCTETVCEAGSEPKLSGELTFDSKSCSTPATCECVPLPPLPIGIHGQFSSLAKQDGVTVIADYNSRYGDLMVGIVNDDDTVTWHWVDGVPESGVVKGAADGPRKGIITKGANVGTHTAVGLDTKGNIHVFYRDEKNDAMKYARGVKEASAYVFSVYDLDNEGSPGYWPTLITEGDVGHLLFTKNSVESGGKYQSQLLFATIDLSSEPANLSVSFEVVDSASSANPCGIECSGGKFCFPSAGQCLEKNGDCGATACEDGSACNQGTCEPFFVEPPVGTPRSVGAYSELSKIDNGFLAVYYDFSKDAVAFSMKTNGSWDSPSNLAVGTGPYASGVFADGKLHLAYQNRINKTLEYTEGNGSEVIADGLRDKTYGATSMWIWSDIGQDVNLIKKDNGEFVVVYQDAVTHELHRALRTGPNNWMKTTLAAFEQPYTGAHGFYVTMLKVGKVETLLQTFINNQLDVPVGEPLLYE